jgi:phosphoribosyl 1,2-cyclic phosphodiesterase
MRVRFWGTRGSIATPGPSTVRYGGNTTCVEVHFEDGTRLVMDAGTGIRRLGNDLMAGPPDVPVHLFLTHSHWDHIQGFPFFTPGYDPARRVLVYGFHQSYDKLREILTNQMESRFFPVPFSALRAHIEFIEIHDEVHELAGTRIRVIRNNHPGFTLGFRMMEVGRSFVFLTDNELEAENGETPWDEFVKFAAGAHVLVHDAMYSDEEIAGRRGWGHSTHRQALELALAAHAETLVLFHHDPDHDDQKVDTMVRECEHLVRERKAHLRILGAREDSVIEV